MIPEELKGTKMTPEEFKKMIASRSAIIEEDNDQMIFIMNTDRTEVDQIPESRTLAVYSTLEEARKHLEVWNIIECWQKDSSGKYSLKWMMHKSLPLIVSQRKRIAELEAIIEKNENIVRIYKENFLEHNGLPSDYFDDEVEE